MTSFGETEVIWRSRTEDIVLTFFQARLHKWPESLKALHCPFQAHLKIDI